MIAKNRVCDCLNIVPVQPGNVIDIAPGTVHAIGKGIVLAEIQQNSNLTYRVYDYDRKDALGKPRPLHIEKAIYVISFSPPAAFTSGTLLHAEKGFAITNMIRNKYFELDLLDIQSSLATSTQGDRFYILFITQGDVCITFNGGSQSAERGETVLIPASLGYYTMAGKCQILKIYVPNDV
jgi:mannose-6-phosphate isomerase